MSAIWAFVYLGSVVIEVGMWGGLYCAGTGVWVCNHGNGNSKGGNLKLWQT